jgi:hypothetical protein
MTSSSQTPPLFEEEAPFQNSKSLEKNKNMAMVPAGPKTMFDCADEGQ